LQRSIVADAAGGGQSALWPVPLLSAHRKTATRPSTVAGRHGHAALVPRRHGIFDPVDDYKQASTI